MDRAFPSLHGRVGTARQPLLLGMATVNAGVANHPRSTGGAKLRQDAIGGIPPAGRLGR